jgi:hypothetical protein
MARWVAHRPARGGAVRGPRHRRQGRRDQRDRANTSTRANAAWSRCPSRASAKPAQWYFQRYAAHLPAAGEIVLFDRSWYNRAGVEKVMGFASDAQVEAFLQQAPQFEQHAGRRRHPAVQVLAVLRPGTAGRSASPNAWTTRSRAGSCRRSTWRRASATATTPAPARTMLKATHTRHAPWTLVDFNDQRAAG